MDILVTGGAGFIGSHLAERLLELGHRVQVLDDLSSGRREHLPPGVELVEMDLLDPRLAERVAELRPEAIFHLAAQVSVQRSLRDPLRDAEINLLGSLRLLEAATGCGARKLVYISTAAVYGEPEQLPVPESHPLRPLSPYGASKLAVERYLPIYADRHGLDWAALRLANVYGPRQDPAGEAGVVAIFAARLLAGRPCTIHGDGRQSRDFVYVGDCAEAAGLLLEGGSGIYNIGTGGLTRVDELYRRMRDLTGGDQAAEQGPAKDGEIRHLSLDPARAASELGWRPRTGLDEGLARTLDWFRARRRPEAAVLGP